MSLSEDWNEVDDDKEVSPIVSEDEIDDDDTADVDLTPTPKEEIDMRPTGPIGAIIRNVPMSCSRDELHNHLSQFNFTIEHVRTSYELGTIDYTLEIKDNDPSISDKIIKFNANIHGHNVTMDFADLPKRGRGRRGDYRNGRGYDGNRRGGRGRNYPQDNRRQGGYIRTNSPNQRSNNSNDNRSLRNSSFIQSENSGFQSQSYRNKSSNSLSQSHGISRSYRSSNSTDVNTQSPRTPSDTIPKLAVLSITPEKSKLENLPKKEFDTAEVRDQSIFGSGKPRDEFIVSPIELHSGSSTPIERGCIQEITASPIVPFPTPKNNNSKQKKQNKKQPDQRNQKNKNQNKNSNKNQKSNVKQNRFGALDDDDDDDITKDDNSNGSDNE